jgi:hypothetical protein
VIFFAFAAALAGNVATEIRPAAAMEIAVIDRNDLFILNFPPKESGAMRLIRSTLERRDKSNLRKEGKRGVTSTARLSEMKKNS